MFDDAKFYEEIGKRATELQSAKHNTATKIIVPILLGPFHEEPYLHMKAVCKDLRNLGFIHSMVLDEAPPGTTFEGRLDAWYSCVCRALIDAGYLPVPMLYFPKEEPSATGMGHHAELVDTVGTLPELFDKCAAFKHPEAKVLDHINRIHPCRRFSVNNYAEYRQKVIDYAQGYVPSVEQIIKLLEIADSSQQSLLTSKSLSQNKGENSGWKNV